MYDERTFEPEIIRIADQVFSPNIERKINYKLDSDVEYDAYYETEFVAHCIEITVSQKANKAKHDLEKLSFIINYYKRQFRGRKQVQGWFITKDSLTHEQKEILKSYSNITHEDYRSFQRRLIDSQELLRCRQHHRFGSFEPLRDHSNQEIYVNAPFRRKTHGRTADVSQVFRWIKSSTKNRFIITGDFGSGKSTFAKVLYDTLSREHIHGDTPRFPLYLNLREFAELDAPDEALRRYARRIGAEQLGESIIKSWKADYTYLIIDGFDEATPRTSARDTKRQRDLKHQALLIVRRFVKDSPKSTPIIISGRSSFFESDNEMHSALGTNEEWEALESCEFSDEQIESLLKKLKKDTRIPQWLPRTPLFINYFIDWISQQKGSDNSIIDNPNDGWPHLIDQFCDREISQIDTLPLVKEDLKDLYGELSLIARKRLGNIGPISLQDTIFAFRHLFNDEPEGVALGQLMRLPGLVQTSLIEVGSPSPTEPLPTTQKNFINKDFVDVASALYLCKYFATFDNKIIKNFSGLKHSLGEAGLGCLEGTIDKYDDRTISDALTSINKQSRENYAQIDILDALHVTCRSHKGATITLSEMEISNLDFSEASVDYSKINIDNCFIYNLHISQDIKFKCMPNIKQCAIVNLHYGSAESEQLDSTVSRNLLPDSEVENKIFLEFNSSAYMSSGISLEAAIIATLLHKTYIQSSKGRMETALFSGVPPQNHELVKSLISRLETMGFVRRERVKSGTRWHPIKSKLHDVKDFLSAPSEKKIPNFVG